MATNIAAVLDDLTDYLNMGGVRAALDGADLNTPCVWVEVASIAPDLLSGGGHVTIALNLIVADGPYSSVVANLADLLGDVLDLVSTDGDVTPSVTVLPDGSNCPSWTVNMQPRPYERT